MRFILMFLALAVAANVAVAQFGVEATPYVAALTIGPILVLRDRIHELWSDHSAFQLTVKMTILTLVGGALSYIFTPDEAGARVALAALAAFAASLATDTVVYQSFIRTQRHVRVNVSNAVSAAVDSFVFLTVAFGSSAIVFADVFSQWTAKVAGGALFLVLLLWLKQWRESYDPVDTSTP
jgi:queuosine precursor transporter